MKLVVAVDPDGTSLELVRNINGARNVAREDCSGQTVDSVVGLTNQVLLIVELDDDNDWAENLFISNLGAFLDIGEDGRLDEVAFVSVSVSALHNSSAIETWQLSSGLTIATVEPLSLPSLM